MSLNFREIDKILSELPLEGSHLQNVRQPDYRSLVLDLYVPRRRYFLYICLETGRTRMHAVESPPSKKVKKPRFVQFLVSRLRGARIVSAGQIGKERFVRLDFRRAGVVTVVWVRLWGGAANVIVTDADGLVLDAFFRRPKRREVSGGRFWATAEELSGGKRDFEVRDFPGTGSYNERVAAHYRSTAAQEERERLRAKLAVQFNKDEQRLTTRINRLRRRSDSLQNPDRDRQLGDLLTANLHRVEDRATRILVEAFDRSEDIEIPLDPNLSPQANAERYYDRYKKARTALERTLEEIGNTEEQLADLRRRRLSVDTSDSGDLDELRSILRSEQQDNRTIDPGLPGLQFRSGPFRILVGRNAKENDELLRRVAKGNDLWLHTRDYAGGFVFIKNIPGKSVPLDTLLDAGNLALYFSKGRRAGKADLYYTHVKHLRRPRSGTKGLVLPTHERNLTIELDDERLQNLLHV